MSFIELIEGLQLGSLRLAERYEVAGHSAKRSRGQVVTSETLSTKGRLANFTCANVRASNYTHSLSAATTRQCTCQ
jgi:hypothetical protein